MFSIHNDFNNIYSNDLINLSECTGRARTVDWEEYPEESIFFSTCSLHRPFFWEVNLHFHFPKYSSLLHILEHHFHFSLPKFLFISSNGLESRHRSSFLIPFQIPHISDRDLDFSFILKIFSCQNLSSQFWKSCFIQVIFVSETQISLSASWFQFFSQSQWSRKIYQNWFSIWSAFQSRTC